MLNKKNRIVFLNWQMMQLQKKCSLQLGTSSGFEQLLEKLSFVVENIESDFWKNILKVFYIKYWKWNHFCRGGWKGEEGYM